MKVIVGDARVHVKRGVWDLPVEQCRRQCRSILHGLCVVRQVKIVEISRFTLKQEVGRLSVKNGVGFHVAHPKAFIESSTPYIKVVSIRYPLKIGFETSGPRKILVMTPGCVEEIFFGVVRRAKLPVISVFPVKAAL